MRTNKVRLKFMGQMSSVQAVLMHLRPKIHTNGCKLQSTENILNQPYDIDIH